MAGPSTVSWTESVILDVISAALTDDIIKKGATSRASLFIILDSIISIYNNLRVW